MIGAYANIGVPPLKNDNTAIRDDVTNTLLNDPIFAVEFVKNFADKATWEVLAGMQLPRTEGAERW